MFPAAISGLHTRRRKKGEEFFDVEVVYAPRTSCLFHILSGSMIKESQTAETQHILQSTAHILAFGWRSRSWPSPESCVGRSQKS